MHDTDLTRMHVFTDVTNDEAIKATRLVSYPVSMLPVVKVIVITVPCGLEKCDFVSRIKSSKRSNKLAETERIVMGIRGTSFA